MDITLKVLNEDDIAFITELLSEKSTIDTLHNEVLDYSGWLNVYHKYWKNDPDECSYIILADGISVGWLKLNGLSNKDIAWISMLVIRKDHRGKGIGRKAVEFSEGFFRSRGYTKSGIHTTDDNAAAHGLYTKCGYTITEHGECTTGDGVKRMGYSFVKKI